MIDRETLSEFRRDGFSWQQIADSLGVALITVRRAVKRYGLTDGKVYYRSVCHRPTLEEKARDLGYPSLEAMVIDYRYEGKPESEVARVLECNVSSIHYWVSLKDRDLPATKSQVEARRQNAIKLNRHLDRTGGRCKMKG